MAWLDKLFHQMLEAGASDLHLSAKVKPMFRVSGEMVTVEGYDETTPEKIEEYLKEITPQMNWDEVHEKWDTDFAYALQGTGRFPVKIYKDHKGMGTVCRLVPDKIHTTDALGLPRSILNFCYLTKGLVVVTGPTGSGKSTTLAAMIDHINRNRTSHIITIEDPIEFVHPNIKCLINQREVRRHTQSFKNALRAGLREDPDIVLVGEMRDLETVEIALETAETGHLVFATLHTSTAPSTVDRIIDQFPGNRQAQIRTMLAVSLKGVIAQTLCKKKTSGRVAALEILVSNFAIGANIRDGKTHQIASAMQVGLKQGMKLLNDSLLEHIKADLITPTEAYMKCVDKSDMIRKLESVGIHFDVSSVVEG